ncbi:unnamed protein product [Spodoptera exigua]|nr:unnamed protein product [Spodoptera exigua]
MKEDIKKTIEFKVAIHKNIVHISLPCTAKAIYLQQVDNSTYFLNNNSMAQNYIAFSLDLWYYHTSLILNCRDLPIPLPKSFYY